MLRGALRLAPAAAQTGPRGLLLARRLAGAAVLVGLAFTLAARASVPAPEIQMTSGGGGSLEITNSKEGQAILSLAGMRPGDSTSATVTIENSGSVDGVFELSKSNLSDTPGIGGGKLSARLGLTVTDVSDPASPVAVYAGTPGGMGRVALQTFSPGEAHTYKFSVVFPEGGTPPSPTTGDNAYQGASMSIQYEWTATEPDTHAPETTILTKPSNPSGSSAPTFTFASSENGSTFECALDHAGFQPCVSPKAYAGLANGSHIFHVRATDGAGNTDATPASYTWTIHTTAAFTPLSLGFRAPRELAWAKRSPIVLRVYLSKTAKVTTRLYDPSGRRIYALTKWLAPGRSDLRLRVATRITRAGYHSLRVVAVAPGETKHASRRVRILAPRLGTTVAPPAGSSGPTRPAYGGAGPTTPAVEGGTPAATGTPTIVPDDAAGTSPTTEISRGAPVNAAPTGLLPQEAQGGDRAGRSGPAVTPVAPSPWRGRIGLGLLALATVAALFQLARAAGPVVRGPRGGRVAARPGAR